MQLTVQCMLKLNRFTNTACNMFGSICSTELRILFRQTLNPCNSVEGTVEDLFACVIYKFVAFTTFLVLFFKFSFIFKWMRCPDLWYQSWTWRICWIWPGTKLASQKKIREFKDMNIKKVLAWAPTNLNGSYWLIAASVLKYSWWPQNNSLSLSDKTLVTYHAAVYSKLEAAEGAAEVKYRIFYRRWYLVV